MTHLDVKDYVQTKERVLQITKTVCHGRRDDREHCQSRILLIRPYDRRVQQRYLACVKCKILSEASFKLKQKKKVTKRMHARASFF